ncbi:MAG: ExeM/NucH family extracellular endonuclease [bacterium]|nr:ExeM/NucH family extracellular endonuclease [bacterium]
MPTTILREGFEADGNGTRYITSVPEFSDGFGDFFTRSDGSNTESSVEYLGATGDFYFAGMDLDGEGATLPLTLTFSDIDISGSTDLGFSVDLAEDDDGSNEDWDDNDFVLFEYRIDGGAWQNLLQVAEFDDGDGFNQAPGIDTDFDGQADGALLTASFATFSADIAGVGSLLDLRVTFQLDSGDEDIAIDEIVITDGGGGPTGPAYTLQIADTTVAEDGAPVGATLTRTGDTSAAVAVALTSSDTTEASVPAEVTFAEGESTVSFDITPVADGIVDLDQSVTITGTIGADVVSETLEVLDAESGPILISTIQGSGGSSDYVGREVMVEGIVTGVYVDGLRGFFVQEEDADWDGDAATSEGIFVFAPDAAVAEGDKVRVTGEVGEFFGLTQISAASVETQSGGNDLPTSVEVTLPIISDPANDFEALEGMRLTFTQELTITQLFNYERFGELQLSTQGLVPQYTQIAEPDPAGFAAYQAQDEATRIILDDGASGQNPATLPFLDVDEFSAGDTIAGLTGVLNFSFGDWKVLPTEAAPVVIQNTVSRQEAPEDVGGDVKVASFNVLNYFTTIDDGINTVNGQEPRGADSEAELARQTSKIVAALNEIDADVVGLVEIENDDGAATQALVDALNAVSGRSYAKVDTGRIGTDAIKVAFIYDTETMKIADGTSIAVLDDPSFVNPIGDDPKNRPALAVTFEEKATGEKFTAVNNHLKSKGSAVDGDPDLNDGQGNGAATRTLAAEKLVDWLATDPTGSGDARTLVIGDLNAYAQEDPIDAIREGADDVLGTADDFIDLLAADVGAENASSFRFSGQWGTLDYAMANTALAGQVTGVTAWNINSLEPAYLDYNDAVRDSTEPSFARVPDALEALFDANSPFRSSDHDPIIVGLDLDGFDERIVGTSKRDVLFGTLGDDLIEGLMGNDRLFGLDGDDDLKGGKGNDRVFGGIGNDRLKGGEGNDRLFGGFGDDLLHDGSGNDRMFGGFGDDTFEIGGGRNDRVETGFGADTIVFSAALAGNGNRDRLVIDDFDVDMDVLDLDGTGIAKVRDTGDHVRLILDGDRDVIVLRGVESAEDIIFADDTLGFV